MKFSIITAVYNRRSTIGMAIDSVAKQTHPDIEHLIIDGGSDDGTLAEVEAKRHSGMRIISEPDEGIYDALNKGMKLASGDVIGLMHSDDFFAHDSVLANVAEQFVNTKVDAVYGDLDYVSAKDPTKVVRHWRAGAFERRKLRWGWMPPHPAVFIRQNVIGSFGGYNTEYRIAADYDALLRWFSKGLIEAAYIPEVLVKMRMGGESNRSLERIYRKSREDYKALKSNQVGGFLTLAMKNISKLPQFVKVRK